MVGEFGDAEELLGRGGIGGGGDGGDERVGGVAEFERFAAGAELALVGTDDEAALAAAWADGSGTAAGWGGAGMPALLVLEMPTPVVDVWVVKKWVRRGVMKRDLISEMAVVRESLPSP